ncbi:hypothetical protein GOV10_03630 [Candidatus Woesearchaeota archaeon]|nr:hypothetical protein [Candidatus Woesearchaeota archaeon]
MKRNFIKKTTNVGGCIGIIIPNWVCRAEGIEKGKTYCITIEEVSP